MKKAIGIETQATGSRYRLGWYVLGTIRKGKNQDRVYPCWVLSAVVGNHTSWSLVCRERNSLAYHDKAAELRRVGKYASLAQIVQYLNLDYKTPHWIVLDMLREIEGFEAVTGIFRCGNRPM